MVGESWVEVVLGIAVGESEDVGLTSIEVGETLLVGCDVMEGVEVEVVFCPALPLKRRNPIIISIITITTATALRDIVRRI